MSAERRSEPLGAATVRKVASLARLHLDDAEQSRLATQMAEVLGYVDRLREVDTANVEPMAHPADATGTPRPDAVTPGLGREAALASAPRTDGQAFLVPQILDAE